MKIEIEDLRNIQGIGDKTIERIYQSLFKTKISPANLHKTLHYTLGDITIYNGEALSVMASLALDGVKVDAVITDPPYNTTVCSWDLMLPLDEMWHVLSDITHGDTPIILMGNQPFTSKLIQSNQRDYKYNLIWDKGRGHNFATVNIRPFNSFEDIVIFYNKQCTYNPQKWKSTPYKYKQGYVGQSKQTGLDKKDVVSVSDGDRYPLSIVRFTVEHGLHPTQKPVPLMEYLIKTYTNEGDTVLDFTMGSGTTAIACMNTNRKFVGIELDEGYYEIAKKRINENIS